MSDPIADAYVQWATEQRRMQPAPPPQEIRVTHDCVMAMTMTWQQCGGRLAYGACARAAWPHLFHAWVDGLTEADLRATLRALGPADPRRGGV